jgi:hypothetical protein
VLNLTQDYMRAQQRIHNRLLHGWGVASGMMVCTVPTSDNKALVPWQVMIQPGYALAPSGDGILLPKAQTVDLRSAPNCVDPCANGSEDPWCSDTYVARDEGIYYIAIRYAETSVRPERVQPSGCGCGDTSCEDSRLRDGFETGVLCECPLTDDQPPAPDLNALLRCDNLTFPGCTSSPWVGLASVEVDANGNVLLIDNCACRRLVVSFANFWWKCDCQPVTMRPNQPDPVLVTRDKAPVDVTVQAQNVDPNAVVRVTRDVTAKIKSYDPVKGLLTLSMTASPNAASGPRTLVLTNPDGSMATLTGAVEVAPAPNTKPRTKRFAVR